MQSREVQIEMEQLVRDGAFSLTKEEDVRVSPVFLIPKRTGGTRLIHDLRGINGCIRAPHFTLRGARDAAAVVANSNWLCALDLKRGYQQVYMDPTARKYLGARMGRETVVSNVLPFGLSLSPYIFTRLTNWVAGLIRKRTGLHIAVYIDDFLVGSDTKEQLESGLNTIRELFRDLGIVLSEKKEIVVAEQVEYLGFLWSAGRKAVGITEERRRQYRRIIKNLLRAPQPVVRWRSVVGKLIFLREAVGSALRHVRSILRFLRGRKDGARVSAPDEVREDLTWWLRVLEDRKELSLVNAEVTASIATDASDAAVGYVLEVGQEKIERTLELRHRDASINARELEALLRCLENHGDLLQGRRALWYSDNVTARAAVLKQGTQAINQQTWEIAREILDILEAKNISLVPKHVPGSLNRGADALSRPGQEDDKWGKALEMITNAWGPLELDPCGFTRASTGPIEDTSWATKRTLLKPRTGKIADTLELLRLVMDTNEREDPPSFWTGCAVLITPTWEQAFWWNQLKAMRRDWISLGRMTDASMGAWEARNSHPPLWTASLIATRAPSGPQAPEINTKEH